jgi:cobalamin biosynthesis Mg chelatase CobN
MQGALRRPSHGSARSFFVLPLVLALLALAAFPVFAHAGGIPQYEITEETSVPHKTTETKPKTQGSQQSSAHNNNPKAEGSAAAGESNSKSEPETESSTESEPKKSAAGGGGNGNGGGNKPGGEGGGGKSTGQAKPENGIEGQKVASAASGVPASATSGGGSSPVVPILIAVVVLAAISIGVVLYRQRKGGSDPDRRVSSPNAS